MSATMVMTAPAPTTMISSSETAAHCCPQCGFNLAPALQPPDSSSALVQAQRQIDDLEAQVRLLNDKASAAVDRWADYEDELARLRSALDTANNNNKIQNQDQQQRQSTSTTASSAPPTTASPARSSFLPSSAASRISALLSPRKPLPALPPDAAAAPGSTTTEDLAAALARERLLRREAEGRLSETSREVEDLSVSLFEQANEMVATERRARAALEARVALLEDRERGRRGRLDRLEAAVGRIGRVRGLLAEEVPGGEAEGGEKGEGGEKERA